MKIVADLHIHSKYARATSKTLDLENLEKYALTKGVNLLGTGDFTHPEWIKEIKTKLREDGTGILKSESGFPFLLQTEISLAYTQDKKGRRVHHLIMAPSLEIVEQITEFLLKKGRVDYDGRPIFGMSSIELVDSLISISNKCLIIPAHLWTPFFGAMGSESGFDSIQECFGDRSKFVYAVETGLSSDPQMNWRIPSLDSYNLVSFSDLHSYWPWRIGRECTIFNGELMYDSLFNAIKTQQGLLETIETNPAYGKYHLTGHRFCGVCLEPNESLKLKNICPKCGRKLTVGVAQRVEQLAAADRPEGYAPEGRVPFKSLIPLSEIIAELNGFPVASRKMWQIYNSLISRFGNEFNVLLEATEGELKKAVDEKLAAAIIKNREGKIKVEPGYDGVYGKPVFDGNGNRRERETAETITKRKQKGLSEFF